MDEKLENIIRRLAGNELLKIEVHKKLEELNREYGAEEVERAIVRKGYADILLQKHYEVVEKLNAHRGRKRGKDHE